MNDDYLWDRSGEPDPDVETLERRLSVLAQGSPPVLKIEVVPQFRTRFRAGLIAAATLVVVASGVFLVYRSRALASGWDIAVTAGAPTIASKAVGEGGRLPVGGWLETDDRSTASLTVGPSAGSA